MEPLQLLQLLKNLIKQEKTSDHERKPINH